MVPKHPGPPPATGKAPHSPRDVAQLAGATVATASWVTLTPMGVPAYEIDGQRPSLLLEALGTGHPVNARIKGEIIEWESVAGIEQSA